MRDLVVFNCFLAEKKLSFDCLVVFMSPDYQFFVKEVVDPDVVLRIFVQRRNVEMAVR